MFYGVLSESKYVSGGYIKSYGIVTEENTLVRDITDDYGDICELVRRLNRYEVEPLHMYDVIDDFLVEKYTLSIKPDGLR